MDEHHRVDMAGDVLIDLWRSHGSDAVPRDRTISFFARGITEACEEAGSNLSVSEAALRVDGAPSDLSDAGSGPGSGSRLTRSTRAAQ